MLSDANLTWLTALSPGFFMWAIIVVLLMQAGGILLLVVNIYRRRQAEEALQISEAQARQVIESSPVGICIVTDSLLSFVNDAFVKMFGYAFDGEIIGRNMEELHAPEVRERQRRLARDRSAGKAVPAMFDSKGLKKDGSRFDIAAWVNTIRYKGRPSSLCFIVDRSVEKQLRQRLDQTNRLEAIGTLAGGIAHDFNNILTAINGYTELATTRIPFDEPAYDDLQQVLKAGRRAKDLVQQILTFSRNKKRQLQVLEVSPIAAEVLGLVQASLPETIQIDAQLQSEAVIHGDPTQLHQLLMNLCMNAEHAMRQQGGTLGVVLEDQLISAESLPLFPGVEPGEYMSLTVSDTGPGIPEQIIEKIYEPFFTTKETGEGTGMGLSQVHGIVTNHRGFIRTENNIPHGVKFNIIFPIVSRDSSSVAAPLDDILPYGTEKILVVDDEEMVAKVLQQTLSDLGYDVVASYNSREALEQVKANLDHYDLILSDMTMPYLSGENMAREILRLRPNLPIVLCTGFSATFSEEEAMNIGVRAFLQKPMEKEQLAKTIRNVLDAA